MTNLERLRAVGDRRADKYSGGLAPVHACNRRDFKAGFDSLAEITVRLAEALDNFRLGYGTLATVRVEEALAEFEKLLEGK